MIERIVVRTGVLLAMVYGLAGCSDDTTGPVEPTLTLEESEALLEAINLVGARALEADPESFAGSVNLTANCSGGGVVNAAGTLIPSETETGVRLLADLTIVPEGCVETARGSTFTLTGAPSLRQTGSYAFSMPEELAFVFDLNVSMVGALAYEVDERDGTCEVSVTVESRLDFGDLIQTGRASGTLCGNTVDIDLNNEISLTPDPGG
ncbi:MAG: hypothetical protein F4164_02595 [Gemmatimonadales bacterium]|nr:hypothetical protein [Gemmatimonadales bacterium]MYG48264.1 hypothetical protein [Gemmatimonadales bacterium]MYK01448.1 hypothetical protein [Candidatus Palauibacter ramosifaciens]